MQEKWKVAAVSAFPPKLVLTKVLRGLRSEQSQTLTVAVPDPALLLRLQRDVRIGDILLATLIDSAPGQVLPFTLKDFQPT